MIPAIKGDAKLYFQTLVAINVLKIAEREIALRPTHVRTEWARINALDATEDALPFAFNDAEHALAAKITAMCSKIRAGAYDDESRRRALFGHLTQTARESLEISNPKLLQTLDEENG